MITGFIQFIREYPISMSGILLLGGFAIAEVTAQIVAARRKRHR